MRQNDPTEENSSNRLLATVQDRVRQVWNLFGRMFNRESEYTQVPYRDQEPSSSLEILLDLSEYEQLGNSHTTLTQYDHLRYKEEPESKLEWMIRQFSFFPKEKVDLEPNQTPEIEQKEELLDLNFN